MTREQMLSRWDLIELLDDIGPDDFTPASVLARQIGVDQVTARNMLVRLGKDGVARTMIRQLGDHEFVVWALAPGARK